MKQILFFSALILLFAFTVSENQVLNQVVQTLKDTLAKPNTIEAVGEAVTAPEEAVGQSVSTEASCLGEKCLRNTEELEAVGEAVNAPEEAVGESVSTEATCLGAQCLRKFKWKESIGDAVKKPEETAGKASHFKGSRLFKCYCKKNKKGDRRCRCNYHKLIVCICELLKGKKSCKCRPFVRKAKHLKCKCNTVNGKKKCSCQRGPAKTLEFREPLRESNTKVNGAPIQEMDTFTAQTLEMIKQEALTNFVAEGPEPQDNNEGGEGGAQEQYYSGGPDPTSQQQQEDTFTLQTREMAYREALVKAADEEAQTLSKNYETQVVVENIPQMDQAK